MLNRGGNPGLPGLQIFLAQRWLPLSVGNVNFSAWKAYANAHDLHIAAARIDGTIRWQRRRVSRTSVISHGGQVMAVYVIEIKGRAIAAFHAENSSAAQHRTRDRALRDDLMALANHGQPLWDGITSIQVRPAFADEDSRWRASHAKAIRLGNIEKDDHTWIAFLVALTDPERRRPRRRT